jgi:hypothetical protein
MRARGWIRKFCYLLVTAAALVAVLLAGAANWPRG